MKRDYEREFPAIHWTIDSRPSDSLVVKRVAAGVFWAAAATLLILHVLAVSRETVNWDEFAFLARAQETLHTGRVNGGGRPGLATLAATPAVRNCTDSVAAVRIARYEWIGFTLLMLGGTWVLLNIVCRRAASPALGASMGLGLLVLVPVFQRWSLQVRADQPALAASLWAGVLLLEPKRRVAPAFAAGMLFGIGYLCSQKAIYVGLLLAVLAIGDLLVDGSWVQSREERRALGFAGGALASIALYRLGVSALFVLPPASDLRTLTGAFAGYRSTIGFNPYIGMLPTLLPHGILLALLTWATWQWRGGGTPQARALMLSWFVLAAGVAVGLFHAATFPYFWMTLGLFPAFALALGLDGVLALITRPAGRLLFLALVVLALLVPTLRAAVRLLDDSQEPQRLALEFIHRNFRPTDRGFHPESALFCREEPAPFPTYFSQDIDREFYGPGSAPRTAAFLHEFRTRPVAFLLASFRLEQFPPDIRRFWAERYVSYRDNVFVPGREVSGTAGARIPFDVLAPGPYRWLPATAESASCVSVDGRAFAAGEAVPLGPGEHDIALSCPGRGWLALALRDRPGGEDRRPFYGLAMMLENSGIREPSP